MLGYVILTLGGLLFGAMVYRYDMHEREPWWMLLGAAVAGGLMMAGAFELELAIGSALIDGGPELPRRLVKPVLAGLFEEPAKLAVPVAVLLLVKRYFNDPMDGLIYGSLAGLGAALYESLWYTVVVNIHTRPTPIQEHGSNAMRLLMHTLWGGIGAFALGLIVMKKPWRKPLAQSLGLVIAMHIAWDAIIGFAPEQTNWQRLAAAVLLALSVVWYGTLVVRANKWSRQMHAPSSKKRLVGRIVRYILTKKMR